ncbi:calcium/sodium antiporter [Actibacterium sp. D379-3]
MADLLYAILGLAILLLAGDSLVKGAVNMSLRVGIPALIVSLTIVAFGTSAPELLIAVKAVLDNAPGIALGNVVGSNTANVLLVLGIPAMISGLQTDECDTRRNYAFMLAATLLFIAICFMGPIRWLHGIVLLGLLSVVLYDALAAARAHRRDLRDGAAAAEEEAEDENEIELEEIEGADPTLPVWKIVMFMGLGLVGLPLGADLLVDSSVNIARDYGVSETVIGLTLVAVGTSLPELATTVMAALRKQADVALGNVIGSNMFNLLAIIGIASFVGDMAVPREMLSYDLWVMLGASLLLIPFVYFGWNITKRRGVILTTLYFGYVLSVLI